MSLMLLGILNSQAAGGGGGAYDLLETTTLTSSASSVTFSGLGSYSDYAHLQIRLIARGNRSATIADTLLQINGDTGSNYAKHALFGTGSSVGSFGTASTSNIQIGITPASTNTANLFGPSVVDILDFNSTSKNKTVRSLFGNAGSTSFIGFYSGLWADTEAVTSLLIYPQANDFIAGSRFSLFGLKGN